MAPAMQKRRRPRREVPVIRSEPVYLGIIAPNEGVIDREEVHQSKLAEHTATAAAAALP